MRQFRAVFIAAAMLVVAANTSFAAVTLQQSWQAGKQLVYGTSINGNLDLQIPADVPTVISGMPLEIGVRAAGSTILDTLKVNTLGDGTVQVKINPLAIEAESYGQKALIQVKDGAASLTLNGSPQKADFLDWNRLTNPPMALTFSPQLKVTQVTRLDAVQPVSTGPASGPMMTMMQNLILQALPALLPNKSLNDGDQWTSDVQFKSSPAPDAPVVKLGSLQFQLIGPETQDGRTVQHITVKGQIDVSQDQSSALAGQSGADQNAGGDAKAAISNHLFSLDQTISGDLYFDAQAGDMAQANLNLQSKTETFPKDQNTTTPDGYMDFNGTLQFKLM